MRTAPRSPSKLDSPPSNFRRGGGGAEGQRAPFDSTTPGRWTAGERTGGQPRPPRTTPKVPRHSATTAIPFALRPALAPRRRPSARQGCRQRCVCGRGFGVIKSTPVIAPDSHPPALLWAVRQSSRQDASQFFFLEAPNFFLLDVSAVSGFFLARLSNVSQTHVQCIHNVSRIPMHTRFLLSLAAGW